MSIATITAIRPLRSNPLRCSIRVGRKVVATMSLDRVESLGLEAGMEWDERLAERVDEAAANDKAQRDATRIIGRRMIGSAELVQKLQRKGHERAAIDAAMAWLQSRKLLDDEAYGRAVIRQQKARKPAGRRLLQQKLMQKRLPGKVVDQLLNESDSTTDAVADARRFAESKLRTTSFQKLDALSRKRRIYGALARRGFDHQTIKAALRGLLRSDDGDL